METERIRQRGDRYLTKSGVGERGIHGKTDKTARQKEIATWAQEDGDGETQTKWERDIKTEGESEQKNAAFLLSLF